MLKHTANKPKMSPEAIVEKMKLEKGIRFEKISEEDAVKYLRYNNNYFRAD